MCLEAKTEGLQGIPDQIGLLGETLSQNTKAKAREMALWVKRLPGKYVNLSLDTKHWCENLDTEREGDMQYLGRSRQPC